jgi:hypothetical protein
MAYVIRNYGPTRQLPYKNQYITITNDGAIETNDEEMVNVLRTYPKIHVSGQKDLVVPSPSPIAVEIVVEEVITEEIQNEIPYENMTKRQLVNLAQEKSIKVPKIISKSALIKLIKESKKD